MLSILAVSGVAWLDAAAIHYHVTLGILLRTRRWVPWHKTAVQTSARGKKFGQACLKGSKRQCRQQDFSFYFENWPQVSMVDWLKVEHVYAVRVQYEWRSVRKKKGSAYSVGLWMRMIVNTGEYAALFGGLYHTMVDLFRLTPPKGYQSTLIYINNVYNWLKRTGYSKTEKAISNPGH